MKDIHGEYVDFIDIKIGNVLKDINTNEEFVCINTDMNGDDEYYSFISVIRKEDYKRFIGKRISEYELYSIQINYSFQNYYILLDTKYDIDRVTYYTF